LGVCFVANTFAVY